MVIKSKSYSLSSLSWMISMCSSPRNPHLNPNPIAAEFSGSYTKAASLVCSFSKASLRSGYWSFSVGKRPQKTMGCASW